MFNLTEKDIARFWEKVDIRGEDECWPWMAARIGNGYGSFTIANKKRGGLKVVASRISCYLAHGPCTQSWNKTLHSCDNPPCCNPAHLRWGTQQHNVDDAVERNRHVLPPKNTPGRNVGKMPVGSAVYNQSLTEAQVREIWRLHLIGGMTTSQIAMAVGAKQHTVADVARGRSWRHLSDAPTVAELKAGGVRRGHNQFTAS